MARMSEEVLYKRKINGFGPYSFTKTVFVKDNDFWQISDSYKMGESPPANHRMIPLTATDLAYLLDIFVSLFSLLNSQKFILLPKINLIIFTFS